MATSTFDFKNRLGQALSSAIERGAEEPLTYAVFAHCFTCGKDSLAAVRISRALAEQGVGVLRFDFTGLGESQGATLTGVSRNVSDLVDAVGAMNSSGREVQLLIGHSLGGTAVLAAASALPSVRAAAVVGSPFEPAHVLKNIREKPGGDQEPHDRVVIGGRFFTLAPGFRRDVIEQDQGDRIARLEKALLILHSPIDDVVNIAEASRIFATAKHPKSFVSLDTADHLLGRREDAEYCAGVIVAWSRRYISPTTGGSVPGRAS